MLNRVIFIHILDIVLKCALSNNLSGMLKKNVQLESLLKCRKNHFSSYKKCKNLIIKKNNAKFNFVKEV